MTNPDDLLRAIIADPANDDLRLVFADLLDDRGEGERASFIRHQIAIAQQYPDGMECERTREFVGWFAKFTPRCRCRPCTMARREYMLCRHRLHVEWDCGEPWSCWPKVWSRGFISSVTCDYSDWARHADSITARCPIERVALTTFPAVRLETYDGSGPRATIEGVKAKYQPHHESYSDMVRELFAREWPRIAFTLPAEVAV